MKRNPSVSKYKKSFMPSPLGVMKLGTFEKFSLHRYRRPCRDIPRDIASNPRVSNAIIDIGAYEFQFPGGIVENKNSSTINFYPNPSSGKFSFQSIKENISKIEIYNLLGSAIYNQNLNRTTPNEIDLSASPKGIYFAKLYNEEKSYITKIVIE